ncbi:MAG: RHS repeat-associated core domain-containing protein [Bacteroidales bacterium]|jgi:RHS repeat-associated protein|nr:hypothetical protein [Bacteroidales bacterium]MDI9575057.1 RHS repeat-associated core domain-containing protein [Bacteroidota bacterium]MDD3755658.1 hypothetical protein [Bacteroidales bacterium]MDY0401499.1 RHS repeat-associated core domain-containing protein [Bacteroidales bacterium]HHW59090.1 hypothetical protein [Bacteroidales bacterium]
MIDAIVRHYISHTFCLENNYHYSNYKELDNETNYTYFGARYYDSELSVWLSVDPMSDKYPSLSPYCYTADNPVVLVDPNGNEIRIYYKEKKGISRLFERSKYITYTPGMKYTGENNFVSNAVDSLNYIYNKNADVEGIIQQSVATSEIVNVKKSFSDYYDDSKNTIYWSTKGMKTFYKINGTYEVGKQSGALGLFHELGHFYRDIFKHDEFEKEKNMIDQDYDFVEERRVIEEYETPAAIILNQGIRNNHWAKILNTVDPLSTKTRKEQKNNVPML